MASSRPKLKTLPTDKLVASGWGAPKAGSRMQPRGSAPTTARSAASSLDKTPKKGLEDSINLEVMLRLRETFMKADADGGGDLDVEEFVAAFDGVLPAGSRDELRKLFLRIDANSDGTVDWDEFASYILLENQGAANLRESETVLQFHPSQMPDKVPMELAHRSPMMQIAQLPAGSGVGERYATAGRDGTVRLWSVKDMSHHKTIINGTAWVTSLVFTPNSSKLAVASFSRTVKLYDLVNGDMCGCATELDHAVYTMDCATSDKAAHEMFVFGDIGGCVTLLSLMEQNDPGSMYIDSDVKREDMFRFRRHWKQELHTDWVSNAKYIPDLAGIVTSSLDKTLAIVDVERRVETKRMIGHTKGVHAFEWTALYKFVASAGMDRKVMLWNPFSCKHIAVLQGHAASVRSVAINERDNQIISMSADKVIKVWDIRNHKCMQTFQDTEVYRPENIISAMKYDQKRRWLVTGNMKLKTWPLRSVINKTSGAHATSVSCVLYSPNFAEAITADHAGTVCVWVVSTGKLRFRFTNAHNGHRVTAMTLDANNRRLITGSDNGQLKMWNFSSGACIKTMEPRAGGAEITGITCTQGMYFNNHILSVGWDRKITFYDDDDAKHLSPIRQIGHKGHIGDILSTSIMEGSGTLATSGYEGHILIWNVDSGAIKQRLVPDGIPTEPGVDGGPPEGVAVEKVQFMFGKLHHVLVAIGADRWVRIWDALEGRLLFQVHTSHRYGESIVSLACREDNKFIVTGDSGGWIKVWDSSFLTEERGHKGTQDQAIKEHACWQAHKGSVTDLAWLGTNEPFVMSSSSDRNVTIWHLDGAKVGDFGKDEWKIRDETTWITRGSEILIADPNAGLKDNEMIADELKAIVSPNTSASIGPARQRSIAATDRTAASVASQGSDLSEEEEDEEADQDDMEAVPSSLILDIPAPLPVRKSKGPVQSSGTSGKDPRMEKVFLPRDSKRINHAGTQGREKTSIHHLIHVSELKDLPPMEAGKLAKGPMGGAADLRPHTVGLGAVRPEPGSSSSGKLRQTLSARTRGNPPFFANGFGDLSKFSTYKLDSANGNLSKPKPSGDGMW
eukprot:CAMPEP_0117689666 /NCGR_PEP_ID=MMETSP0804-20121206/24643_1 /TAXON_ID=1074897 /ORGANISM="Tetraselmis astigmatica, Strain CCMP880" /LENGTH=1073 /DNA_ID=CAMNT_0005502517 /DNA_START=57 /DNA_END=3278 /DNA_ORIENTATION=+